MNLKKYRLLYLSCFLLGVFISACSKMEDSYKDYVQGGEIIYTGRVDSVKVYPGQNRIKLSMLLLSDPKITTVKVFWNDKMDSAVQNITRTSGVDTVYFLLDNMTEATYSFHIYTYDDKGHSSIKTEVIGSVYGQTYINSLFNRSLKSVTYVNPNKARLVWFGPSAQNIGQQINYTDSITGPKTIYAPRTQDTTWLLNFKKNASFEYRTMYKPDPNAIDTFYSQYTTRQVL